VQNKILLILLLFFNSANSQINNIKLTKPDTCFYSFIALGHAYGDPMGRSTLPALSLRSNIDFINALNIDFIVSLGDNIKSTTKANLKGFQDSFLNRVKVPVFNAVGNHDVINYSLYNKWFGKTYYHYHYGGDLFIFLDTEENTGDIKGLQLDYLMSLLKNKFLLKAVNNVFIFSHKLIWANKEKYEIIYKHVNGPVGYKNLNNFSKIIEPAIERLGLSKNIYWLSGDIGVSWSLPLFYNKDIKSNIRYIATGIGETDNDAIIKVNVFKDSVVFKPILLSNKKNLRLEDYNVAYWENHFKEKETPKSQNYISRKVVGFIFKNLCVVLVFGVLFICAVLYFKH
tara:strand:+ start:214 stop:1239 length:1026 start_codon:yes stop_codon:yes gene_type:complete